jgi:glycerol uptake facilitator-like aquaporin
MVFLVGLTHTNSWGLGVMLGIYVAGCAGGHLNPAITFVNCLFRGFPWKKLPAYACAQIAGCFCGAVSPLTSVLWQIDNADSR